MFCFVILHYKNIDDTMECINSIKKIKSKLEYKIIVVDNNSGSKEDLKLIKSNVDDLVVMESNVGFANGNNAGIDLAKKKYKPDFVIAINNDTLIIQDDLLDRISKIYEDTKFDALGFKIITNGGDSVNPFHAYKTIDEVNKAIKKSQRNIKIYESKFLRKALEVYRKIKYTFIKKKYLQNGEKKEEGVSLHGCAIVFSKKYMKKYNDCFYHKTFIYHEEEFLEQRRERDNLIFIYDPKIEIFHKEGSSLDFNFNGDMYKKLLFREKEIIKSLNLLKKVIEDRSE